MSTKQSSKKEVKKAQPLHKVHIRTDFRIQFINGTNHEDKETIYQLSFPTTYGNKAIIVLKYGTGEGAVILNNYELPEDALEFMKARQENTFETMISGYSEEFYATYAKICQELNSLARQATEYIIFFLGRHEIADEPTSEISTFMVSLDNENWLGTPGRITGKFWSNRQLDLDEKICGQLQEGIDNGIMPFVAMRHIYRAMHDANPRFKWIDATIAAELAIKEALIRKKPDLAVFIEYVPSPPLHRLWGEIMEEYFGERSEYCSTIKKGAERRNKLIHQPLSNSVTALEADDYVSHVLIAINQLYGLLYPDWSIAGDVKNVRYFG
jgi:hypothetical protein